MAANGVEVRGLRVIRTFEGKRLRWWIAQIDGLDAFAGAYGGCVLTVSNGRGDTVARRTFKRNRHASKARQRFVAIVTQLSDEDYAMADWQALLDGA